MRTKGKSVRLIRFVSIVLFVCLFVFAKAHQNIVGLEDTGAPLGFLHKDGGTLEGVALGGKRGRGDDNGGRAVSVRKVLGDSMLPVEAVWGAVMLIHPVQWIQRPQKETTII